MTGLAVALSAAQADPGQAAAFLSGLPGYSLRSAADHLRRNPGFLGRALTREAAERLKAAALSAGLACCVFYESELLAPPAPLKAVKAAPAAAGLTLTAGGAAVFLRYEDIVVLSAAAYDAPLPPAELTPLKKDLFSRILDAAGLRAPLAPLRPLETFFRADIVMRDGLRALLEPENLDFSALPGRAHSSLENFRLLLKTVSGPAFGAARNFFLPAFLASLPLAPLKLAGPEAADLELSRLLLLQKRPKP